MELVDTMPVLEWSEVEVVLLAVANDFNGIVLVGEILDELTNLTQPYRGRPSQRNPITEHISIRKFE